MSSLLIRNALADDMAGVADVYAPHVLGSVATFEEVPPTADEMQARLQAVQDAGLVWLVAEQAGRIIGYAYASPYRARAAYRYSVETSVYLAESAYGQGIGTDLMKALLARVAVPPVREVIAVVAVAQADEGAASIKLHENLGFTKVGTLAGVGFKFGRPIDTVFLQKSV